MATFNLHFRPSDRQTRSRGSIFIRIIHERKSFDISTGHRVFPEEWDDYSRTVIVPHPSSHYFTRLQNVKDALVSAEVEFERIVANLSAGPAYSIEDIRTAYRDRNHTILLRDFVEKVAAEISPRQPRTARLYISALRSLEDFNKGRGIMISDVNGKMIESFEAHLKKKQLAMNSISSYMRHLRAVYNRAVRCGLVPTPDQCPFRNVFTGVAKTEKKALDAGQIHELLCRDPSLFNFGFRKKGGLPAAQRDALAYFMFCFFGQGMSFVDLAYLRKSDIDGGIIRYRRKKTGQVIEVCLCTEMRSIIAYFADRVKNSQYVFPIILSNGKPERLQYESALRLQNIRLKKLGLDTASVSKITTHAARHSWASIAKNEKIELSVISEALGHNSESTTRIYLDSFKKKLLDRANEKIRRAIKKAV